MEENLENDISYLLGSYVGMGRTIERELDRLTKKETPSNIEEWLEEFAESPSKAFRHCQEAMLKEQVVLKKVNKPELIEECTTIMNKINVKALEYLELDLPHFLHGYHVIQEEHGFD